MEKLKSGRQANSKAGISGSTYEIHKISSEIKSDLT